MFLIPQLPDLRYLDCRVDFSTNTFRAVVNLCKDLGIRHSEELSLCQPLEAAHLKRNFSQFPKRKYDCVAADTNSFIPRNATQLHSSNGSLDSPNGTFFCAPVQSTPTHQRRHLNPISSPTGVRIRRYGSILGWIVFNVFSCFVCRHGNTVQMVTQHLAMWIHHLVIYQRIWHRVHVHQVLMCVIVLSSQNRWLNELEWMWPGWIRRCRLWNKEFVTTTHCVCASNIIRSSIWIRSTTRCASISCTSRPNGSCWMKKSIAPKRKCWCSLRCR